MKGKIIKISGPVVRAQLTCSLYDVVRVGKEKLLGEVVEIDGDECLIQVYEDTMGLQPNDPVLSEGKPLSIELGPGLLGGVFDGTGRPLNVIAESGIFIPRGVDVPTLNRKAKYEFTPIVKNGAILHPGEIIGTLQENERILHNIILPPNMKGKISGLKKGSYTITDAIAKVDGKNIFLMHTWPVRTPRPTNERLPITKPLITGMRLLDFVFPLGKGGVAAVPGPFGSGKSVIQQQIARWCDADIIVYIGCGERGNEMTDVLTEFPRIKDPKTGKSLMQRTILIANTSNMPVAARESSVYTGITIAEYFRDQGYAVALMADSTSRWAEAMREISGRLEEMPGEEGFPAYLSKRLAEFYERAGMVTTLSKKEGSITVVGAVSPPGGDFSEPVTQNTLRLAGTFWALDAKLANKRHYPAIDWLTSYTQYAPQIAPWMEKNAKGWTKLRERLQDLLQQESQIQEIAQLVGVDSLPEDQQVLLIITRCIREDFLQQDGFHPIDTQCALPKQLKMANAILDFYDDVKNQPASKVRADKRLITISKLKYEEKWQ